MDGIVIGEGVLLDARPASVLTRVLAALIDLAVLFAGVLALFLLIGLLPLPDSDAVGRVLGVVVIAGVTVVTPTAVDTLSRGRSLGKLAVGIRIVRDDGGPIVFRQSLVRALVGVVELWLTFGSVAVICSAVHPQGKRVGDILAGTYAVRVRGVRRDSFVVLMPPRLAWWARSADVARLPDGLALSVRQFLARAPQLHPGSRVELGTALTREVERYVRPLPPAGTHPEEFLAAVIAERRDRELHRLHREAQLEAAEAALVQRLPHEIPDPVD
ncbi:RDD family protein [Cellulomonas alba]|uniref:RDD family protein n=1 Tax=Cellulomonas alba TaxID=3053467 RepID=A0ABT7SD72_9CELL|nr:RDD family protein [Cellulomonas alba]MDM7853999.1 RDD family protein [Cellulomonas alba]